jgi:hypothetical protein
MADNPGMPERFVLWWRRNLDVAYVLGGALIFTIAVLCWYAYGPVTMAWVWGVTHGHTAQLRGTSVRLPPMWRQEYGSADADLHLVKPSKWRTKVETFDVDELHGADVDPNRMLNTLQSLEKMAVSQGETAAVYPLSAANDERFVCMEHGNAERNTLHVTCLERDGKRVTRMVGSESSRQDFAAILTALSAVK